MMGELPQVCTQATRRARKAHKCCECGGIIQPGKEYRYTSGIWEGRPEHFKQCAKCADLWDRASAYNDYPEEGPCFTGLREWIAEVGLWPVLCAERMETET